MAFYSQTVALRFGQFFSDWYEIGTKPAWERFAERDPKHSQVETVCKAPTAEARPLERPYPLARGRRFVENVPVAGATYFIEQIDKTDVGVQRKATVAKSLSELARCAILFGLLD